MKYAFAAIALAAFARAQTISDIPKCAIPCIDDAVGSETSCSTTDYACICKDSNFSAIQGAATSCVIDKCGSDVALSEVLPATEALCENTGDSPAPTTSKSEPEPTTTAAPESSTEAETSAVEVTSTSIEVTTFTSSVAETTVAPTVVVPTNGTIPAPTSTTGTVPTGAAAQYGPIGGMALLGLAALAL